MLKTTGKNEYRPWIGAIFRCLSAERDSIRFFGTVSFFGYEKSVNRRFIRI